MEKRVKWSEHAKQCIADVAMLKGCTKTESLLLFELLRRADDDGFIRLLSTEKEEICRALGMVRPNGEPGLDSFSVLVSRLASKGVLRKEAPGLFKPDEVFDSLRQQAKDKAKEMWVSMIYGDEGRLFKLAEL